MKTLNKLFLTTAIAATLSACASNPNNVAAAYVSDLEYQGYTCAELQAAYAVNDSEAETLYKKMKTKSNTNNVAMGIGIALFWPALFAMQPNDAESDAKLSELKGRERAITSAMTRCDGTYRTAQEIQDKREHEIKIKRGRACMAARAERDELLTKNRRSATVDNQIQELCS